MKQFIWASIALLMVSSCKPHETVRQVVDRGLSVSHSQAMLLARELEKDSASLPRTYDRAGLQTTDFRSWVSGFFPGVLWYLYEDKPSEALRHYAENYTARVEPAADKCDTHDLGFMLYCSFGNGYRIAGNPHYADVMRRGVETLAERFSPRIGAVKSWNTSAKWQYPVIIDNMMNLEFLLEMSKLLGRRQYADMANVHARTTMKNHFRPDYSCYHVVSYDTISGKPHAMQTHQGYADHSAWARGQSWALYGYTMMFRETRRQEYLDQARHIARFITRHPRLPKDKIPYWDYDAPDIPHAKRDASAAAIMASALVELSRYDTADGPRWLRFAEDIVRSLTSPAYLAEPGTNGGFILKHSVGNMNKNSEVDVPLTYGDYYYVEALLRLKNRKYEK